MRLATTGAFAVSWLLTCLVGHLLGYPQQPYWIPYQLGIDDNPAAVDRFSRQISYRYKGLPESQYESIDDFQREQRRQYEYQPYVSPQSPYSHEENYLNQQRNVEKSFHQSLQRTIENPLRDRGIQDSEILETEDEAYHQDFPSRRPQFFHTQTDPIQGSYPSSDQSNELVTEGDSGTDSKDGDILKEVEVLAKALTEKSYVPTMDDIDALNSLEDEMLAEASIPEEAIRVARQVRQQKPGALWTLARLAYEAINDTKSAVQQIGTIVNDNFAPETTSQRPTTSDTLVEVVTLPDDMASGPSENTTTTTTTEAPFRLTRTELQGIVRRNLRGLVRLFNIEWKDALEQSKISTREFHRDLRNQIRPYLQDNPAAS